MGTHRYPDAMAGMNLDYEFVPDTVERAWNRIAAELAAASSGWTVTYGFRGFIARRDGPAVEATTMTGLTAQMRPCTPP
jgi:hypothetical protein